MNVNYVLMLFKAASLSQSFCTKAFSAQYMAMACSMKHHLYNYRMGTHKSQRLPEEVADKGHAWMDHICPLVTGPHRSLRYVIDMDQTPVLFLMNAKKHLS